jgi:hypothetical protein
VQHRIVLAPSVEFRRQAAAEVIIGWNTAQGFLKIRSHERHYELPRVFPVEMSDGGQTLSVTAYWDNASFAFQLGKPRGRRARSRSGLMAGQMEADSSD